MSCRFAVTSNLISSSNDRAPLKIGEIVEESESAEKKRKGRGNDTFGLYREFVNKNFNLLSTFNRARIRNALSSALLSKKRVTDISSYADHICTIT